MKNSLSALLFFIYIISHSQDYKVTGLVIDSKTEKTIEYVNIGISNKGVGTVSNENGIFSLKLNEQVKKKIL